MSDLINELATIEVSKEVLKQLDVNEIFESFRRNFQKLDDLKDFRSEYEKKGFFARLFGKKKLQIAQLDAQEVQAEFSKTIGQLMVLSIIQSKKLYDQQTQLNDQQKKLKSQADGIAEHAGKLQHQHQLLAEQSTRLEALVRDYFALKGLTEDGAKRLVEIAQEIKSTKESMIQEFTVRAHAVEVQCATVLTQLDTLAKQVAKQIQLGVDETRLSLAEIRSDTRNTITTVETALREENLAAQQEMEARIESQSVYAQESRALQTIKSTEIEAILHELSQLAQENARVLSNAQLEFSAFADQQKSYQVDRERFEKETSTRFNRLTLIIVLVSAVAAFAFGGMAHVLGWI